MTNRDHAVSIGPELPAQTEPAQLAAHTFSPSTTEKKAAQAQFPPMRI